MKMRISLNLLLVTYKQPRRPSKMKCSMGVLGRSLLPEPMQNIFCACIFVYNEGSSLREMKVAWPLKEGSKAFISNKRLKM